MKTVFVFALGLVVLMAMASAIAEDKPVAQRVDSTAIANADSTQNGADRLVVYYLHMNRRCATCEKLEAYSREAVDSAFAEQLNDSSIVFRVENFEQEGNEHYAKDYQLYSQSLILSRQHNGKETEWKNLDKIWTLVGDKREFVAYVQTEVASFLDHKGKK